MADSTTTPKADWQMRVSECLSEVTDLLQEVQELGASGESHQRIAYMLLEKIGELQPEVYAAGAQRSSILHRVMDLQAMLEGIAAVASATPGTRAICAAARETLERTVAEHLDVAEASHA
jgi:hypothetical protein